MSTPASKPSQQPRRRRWRRRIGTLFGLMILGLVTIVVALPWLLGTTAGRDQLLQRANQVLAPGRLKVETFRFSWFQPTRMTGFVILDPNHDQVVTAPTAVWDRSLWQILFDPTHRGTLHLDHARLDVVRREDGTAAGRINLVEALQAILRPNPSTDLGIAVHGADLRLTADGLIEPISARLDATYHKPKATDDITWDLRLTGNSNEKADDDPPAALGISGTYNPWRAPTIELELKVAGDRWPITFEQEGRRVRLVVDGALQLHRGGGVWSSTGTTGLSHLAVFEPGRTEPRVRLDRIDAAWDVAQTNLAWDIKKLDLRGDAGTLRTTATTATEGARTHIEGDLDLAKLLPLIPGAPQDLEGYRLDQGRLRLTADAEAGIPFSPENPPPAELQHCREGRPFTLPGENAPIRLAAIARLDRLGVSRGQKSQVLEPVVLTLRAILDRDNERLDLAELSTETSLGALKVTGSIAELGGRRLAELNGSLTYDWDEVNALLSDRLDPRAHLEGDPITLHVAGPLGRSAAGLIERLDAEIQAPIRSADVFGMQLGATSIEVHLRRGQLSIAPITTTLNGGRLALVPELHHDDQGGFLLQLAQGSHLEHAAVNDQVSQRVLSYVVPTLSGATRVRGFVSADIDRAEIPLSGQEGRYTDVQGQVVFQEVEFLPGPLAVALMGTVGLAPRSGLRLDQPVVLAIHDGRVHQRGVSLPLGDVAKVTMEGTVGFDQSLDLVVSVPLSSEKFAEVPVFGNIAGAIRPTIPIRGTLSDPSIDGKALAAGFGRMGLDIGERAAAGGINALLDLMTRPRDPAAEAQRRAEMERRREERRQKKEEQKQRRGR